MTFSRFSLLVLALVYTAVKRSPNLIRALRPPTFKLFKHINVNDANVNEAQSGPQNNLVGASFTVNLWQTAVKLKVTRPADYKMDGQPPSNRKRSRGRRYHSVGDSWSVADHTCQPCFSWSNANVKHEAVSQPCEPLDIEPHMRLRATFKIKHAHHTSCGSTITPSNVPKNWTKPLKLFPDQWSGNGLPSTKPLLCCEEKSLELDKGKFTTGIRVKSITITESANKLRILGFEPELGSLNSSVSGG